MKITRLVILVLSLLILGGCASTPQIPIMWTNNVTPQQQQSIGIAMTKLPAVGTYEVGADCLLCLAVVAAANSSLTSHIETLPYEDLPELKKMLADLFTKKGYKVTVLDEDFQLDDLPRNKSSAPNSAKKDFSSLRESHKLDQLLVIDLSVIGTYRTYASYVPTSDPQASVKGTGYIVNLTDNTYNWYLPIDIMKSAGGAKWDEPPSFPGLTNAYFQALEETKDALLQPFSD